MSHRVHGRALLAATALACIWAAPTAAADVPSWQCRASAYHHSVAGNPPFEPIKADPTPCANAGTGAAQTPATASVPTDVASTGTLSAQTALAPTGGASGAQTATAAGRVENLALNVPGLAVTIGARVARATATARCDDGQRLLDGSSELTGLSVNGTELPLVALVDQVNAALAPLNQVIEIRRDEQSFDGTSLTRRALHVRVLNAAGTPLLDAVAGEAIVGSTGAVCSADGMSGGPSSGATKLPEGACPDGSQYDATRNRCVIVEQGVAGLIVVGRPFDGPSGGKVLSLRQARKQFGFVRCLTAAGPRYAIVGSARADRITGTNGADRILSLGGADRVDGGRGNDCLDGGTGSDALSGALGNDRVFGMTGADALNGGPGSDLLQGGSGNDAINAAYGADRIFGGTGRDVINVATAGPAARVSCGSGPDKVRANANERGRLRGCETRYVLADRGGA